MKRVRWIWVVVACLFCLSAAAAEPLVIYSGRSDKFVKPVVEAFTAKTGIEVILHSAKSTELLNKLRLEGDRTEADLFLSNDAGNLEKGAELGLFAPLPDGLLDGIDPRYRSPDDLWVGLSARARVLVVNTEADGLDFVQSVFDLANPRLEGRLGITNSANESFIAGVTVYLLSAGEERTRAWLQGLKRNSQGQVYAKHSKVVADVAAGRRDLGLVNHYYIYRHLEKEPGAPIRILLPDQGEGEMGLAWNVAGVALSRYSANREAAEELVAFLVSPEGQKLFAEVNREYPTREGVPAAPEVPPVESFRVADVPMVELGRQRDATLDLIDTVGMP